MSANPLNPSPTLRCDGCGVEITWSALVLRSADGRSLLHYCCPDCLDGRECACAERMEQEDERSQPGGTPAGWTF
jgi:hypothetical protein